MEAANEKTQETELKSVVAQPAIDHEGHDETTVKPPSTSKKNWRSLLRSRTMRLLAMFTLTASFFLVELIVGHHLNAMSLIADSFHMLSDVLAITIGLVAIRISKRPSSTHYTFGWKRAEVIGALVNSVFLCALCFSLVIETVQRIINPEKIENPLLMLYVGAAGLLINVVGLILLHFGGDAHGHSHSHGHGSESHGHNHKHKSRNGAALQNGMQCSPFKESEIAADDSRRLLAIPGASSPSKGLEVSPARLDTETEPSDVLNMANDELSVPDVVIQMNITDAHKLNDIVDPKTGRCTSGRNSGTNEKHSSSGGHNMRAVFMHVLGDALGSVIVIISATIVWQVKEDWTEYIDPALSLIIVIIILTGTIPILRDTLRILLETVPRHIRVAELRNELIAIPGVLAIHEFHVWQLQSDVLIASVHVSCASLADYMLIAPALKRIFHNYNIHSTTVQPEFVNTNGAELMLETGRSDFIQQTSIEAPISGEERSKELSSVSAAGATNVQSGSADRSPNAQIGCILLCDSDSVCHRQTCCQPSQLSRQSVTLQSTGIEADADPTVSRKSSAAQSRPVSKISCTQMEAASDTSVPLTNCGAMRTPKHDPIGTSSSHSDPHNSSNDAGK